MAITINGTTGIAGVDGSASTPAVQGGDTNTGVFFPAADTVAIATSGTEAMRADSAGNVGIGTSSPSTYANGFSPTLVVGTGNNWVIAQPRTDGPSGAANGVRLAGNYSTNPKPGSAIWIGAQGSAGQRGMIGFFTKDTDDNTNDPTERARIDSSGNLLVNATSQVGTGGKFQITSGLDTAIFKSTATAAYAAIVVNVENTAARLIAFQYGSGGSPTNVGNISTNGTNTSYNTSSDYRLKHDIAPMTGALSRVAALKPVTYKWNVDNSDGEGFIAHELAEVVPGCVTGAKDAVDAEGKPVYQGIDTSFLVATLTAAIQEQQALIESLTARIAALEAK